MNLFEYLDRRNQRSHLRRMIKHHDKMIGCYCQLYDTCPSELKNRCAEIIKEHEDKVFYYTNKLMKLL